MLPNKEMMQQQLQSCFHHALEGLVEIAYTANTSNALNLAKLFDVSDIEEIVDFAYLINSKDGQNVYFSPALRKPSTPKNIRAKDSDFLLSYCLFADFDNKDALKNAKKKYTELHLKPPYACVTGTIPYPRGHIYFPLNEPITAGQEMKRLNELIAKQFGGDPSICNPSRVMRLAGSIAYPKKASRVKEATRFIRYPDRRPLFDVFEIEMKMNVTDSKTYINSLSPTTTPITSSLKSLLPTAKVDVEQSLRNSQQEGQWHYNMRQAIASMASSGMDEDAIREKCAPYCQNGKNDTDIDALIEGAITKFGTSNDSNDNENSFIATSEAAEEDNTYITARSLSMGNVPKREWLIDEWLPKGVVSSLYGSGGVGKSLVAQALAISIASGIEWCGLPINIKGKVLCVFAEDDIEELHRRQFAIEQGYTISPMRSGMENVYLWSRVGFNNILVSYDIKGLPIETPFYKKLQNAVEELQPELLIIDTAADVFSGDEINRSEVNFFIKAVLGSFCTNFGVTVLLLAHPSISGEERGYSGSTAWNNSVRNRLYLQKGTSQDTMRVLTRLKSNYTTAGEDEKIELYIHNGALLTLDKLPEENQKEVSSEVLKNRIKDLIAVAAADNEHYKWGHSGSGLVKSLLLNLPNFYNEPIKKQRIKAAVDELIDDDEISRWKCPQRNQWFVIVC